MPDTLHRSLAADPAFRAADYWHGPGSDGPATGPDTTAFKEWSHFCVMHDGLDLLINFSRIASGRGVPARPRLTVLMRGHDGKWHGDVEEFLPEMCDLEPGDCTTRLGDNRVTLDDDGYHIDVRLARQPIRIRLDLRPCARPVVANKVRLSATENIRWMVVPHLRATGHAEIDGQVTHLVDAPAYHDRNWGRFSWGGAYAWEWATIVPECEDAGWSLVYSRISDHTRTRTRSQSLILWDGAKPCRKYDGLDISVEASGHLGKPDVLQVPRMMALVLDPGSVDVPGSMTIRASGYASDLALDLQFEDFAHIGVPNDRGLGLTTLCEICGRADVRGTMAGREIEFRARVQAEINSAEP